ncbi:hypothetical protein Glove_275g19 [Diversispora epigaea]|uniref:Protein kinase domain-containing protein n=1 Tax=Diversispora epigaea TaxID=1348612 RepID=A0A397I3J6_9GLOM|nr:hypothetical protein Glove_275g19 [Diversispora epigaea]
MEIHLKTNTDEFNSIRFYGITQDLDIQIYDGFRICKSGDEEYTKAADVYSFGVIAYEIVTGFPPYPDIPHDEDLAVKICNGLRPKIPFHTPKLITRTIMRCWDAQVTHRPTFNELHVESKSRINQHYNNYAPLNYQTHPLAIYTNRLLNYSKLLKPKNEENFERELEELTKSLSHITTKKTDKSILEELSSNSGVVSSAELHPNTKEDGQFELSKTICKGLDIPSTKTLVTTVQTYNKNEKLDQLHGH